MRITEADNTSQYWPNLGSQQSAIVIGPVSSFASVKCWVDDGSLCRMLNLPTFSWNLAQYWPYTKPIVTFTMASSYESRRTRVRPMNATLLGYVSLLPRQSILEVRKPEFFAKTFFSHSNGRMLCRKQVLAARVWTRICRKVHTGLIIPATARYWQPIFSNIFADAGPVLGRI